jgi:uncharacterized protein
MSANDHRPFAVVTGGSSGIGYELAGRFVDNGYDVLIASQDEARLAEAAKKLGTTGAEIRTHASDLATEAGVESLYEAVKASGRSVDVLCVNAGVGLGGAFVETDLKRELGMIDLNVRGAVHLTKLVSRDMVAARTGKILFTSSIAATMPDPFEAVYGGTKVFPTETNFFNRADMLDTKIGAADKKDDPAAVAQAAFDALAADDDKVLPLTKNKVMGAISDMLPDKVAAAAHGKFSRPGSA